MVDFDTRTAQLDDLLGVGRNFDMVGREVSVGGRRARLWVVNGYAEDALIERMIGRLLAVGSLKGVPDLAAFLAAYVTVPDAAAVTEVHDMVMGVFAGKTLLVIDGYDGGILLDAKEYPTRSVQEPDTSKVLRGSHDGFVESIMANAALLRRRIRAPDRKPHFDWAARRRAVGAALAVADGMRVAAGAAARSLGHRREPCRSAAFPHRAAVR